MDIYLFSMDKKFRLSKKMCPLRFWIPILEILGPGSGDRRPHKANFRRADILSSWAVPHSRTYKPSLASRNLLCSWWEAVDSKWLVACLVTCICLRPPPLHASPRGRGMGISGDHVSGRIMTWSLGGVPRSGAAVIAVLADDVGEATNAPREWAVLLHAC